MADHVLTTYLPHAPVFVEGRGATLIDETGRTWLDFLSGIGVTALGHAHPRWVHAVAEQAGMLAHVSNLLRHPYTSEVATRLARLSGLEAVFFSNSGSEANECALKIARKAHSRLGAPERSHFVALTGGFHGRTFGSLSITAKEAYRAPFGPGLSTTFVDPADPGALERALAEAPAALIVEPIQGEGGLVALPAELLRLARELCDRTGTLLIADEVQSGAGRTGKFLACQHAGILPDVVTLAKPLAAGLPIGATLVRKEYADVLQPGDHGSTFGGGPLVLRAALVLLEEIEQRDLLTNVRVRGSQLAAGLQRIAASHPDAGLEQRGLGLMQGLVVPGRAADLQRALFEAGLITTTAAGDVLRTLPPFIVTEGEVDRALELIQDTLHSVLEEPSCRL